MLICLIYIIYVIRERNSPCMYVKQCRIVRELKPIQSNQMIHQKTQVFRPDNVD